MLIHTLKNVESIIEIKNNIIKIVKDKMEMHNEDFNKCELRKRLSD